MTLSPHPLKILPLLSFSTNWILGVKRTLTCSTYLFSGRVCQPFTPEVTCFSGMPWSLYRFARAEGAYELDLINLVTQLIFFLIYVKEYMVTQKSLRWGTICYSHVTHHCVILKASLRPRLPHSRRSLTSRHKAAHTVILEAWRSHSLCLAFWMVWWTCINFCSLETKAKTAEAGFCHPFRQYPTTRTFHIDGHTPVLHMEPLAIKSSKGCRLPSSLDSDTLLV